MSRRLTNEIVDQYLFDSNKTFIRKGAVTTAHDKISWECITLEHEIIHKMKQYQYIPEGKFSGKTECFVDIPEVKEKILRLLE